MKQVLSYSVLACFGAATMLADFSYQQTSKVTGGALQGMMRMAGAFSKQAREPMVSTVVVKGHRMVTYSPHTSQIIDVDKETVTDINLDKKTYTVMTFAQMKQMMEDAAQRMQQNKNSNANDVHFKAAVKETGQTKTLQGLRAKEIVMTLTMEGTDKQTGNTGSMDVNSDMWIAPVDGYDEVRGFYKLYAAKMGMIPGQNMGLMMGRPEMAKGMSDLYKEVGKMDGVPIEMITRIGGSGTGTGEPGSAPAASQQQNAPPPSGNETVAGAALGHLGLGGFGRRKKNPDQQQQQQSGGDPQAASGVLIEMTTESSGFSTAPADPSKFEIPAGFKQVEPEMNNRRGR